VRCPLLAFLALVLLGVPACGQEGRLTLRKNEADPSRWDCDVMIATFTTPKNWQPNTSTKNTYAILSRGTERHPNLTCMISIDIGKPKLATAKASAEDFAEEWKGRVLEKPLKLDGEPAYRVMIPPDGKTLRPVECVIAYHGGKIVLLIGGTKELAGLHDVMEELAATWKWKETK
jgi:hypothetical protein